MAEERKVTKVKLSDGRIYRCFDKDAIRYNEQGILVVGDTIIDNLVINQGLKIIEINDVPADQYTEVVVRDGSKRLRVRPKDEFLEDIGGCSYNMNSTTGVLSLKIGKQ